jgi:hypothetical protein
MKPKLILCFALVLSAGLFVGCSTARHSVVTCTKNDKELTKQISGILVECQKIKPGMTRAELLKVFTTEGGLSTATHRTFVYRGCPYIKIDVDFKSSDQKAKKADEEKPTDIITEISKPYLDWSVID